jgi:hypothetical protein
MSFWNLLLAVGFLSLLHGCSGVKDRSAPSTVFDGEARSPKVENGAAHERAVLDSDMATIKDARAVLDSDMAKIKAARAEMSALETACKAYMIKTGGTPPMTLQDLINPPDGGPPFIGENDSLRDPWGYGYQFDPSHSVNGIDADTLVLTYNPENGKRLTARDKE